MSKKRIFISSTGRTGTQFFAKYLHVMIANGVSLHEPGTPWISKPKRLLQQIRDYGLYHLTLGQGKNTHSMYKLSRDFMAQEVTGEQAKQNILAINGQVDRLVPQAQVVVYSSGHIYGLLGLLDEVYEDSRFVFIIRDPRDWIGSALNKTEYSLYGPIEWIFRKISLQPSCLKDDPYTHQWKGMSKFEKYCWYYQNLNENAIEEMAGKGNFRIFRYEDIFLSEEKSTHFKAMLDFATAFDSGQWDCHFQGDLIDKKVDSKQSAAKGWLDWSPEQAKLMHQHCGPLMAAYGYGTEEAWLEKLRDN